MRTKVSFLLIAGVFALLLSGCSSTESGNAFIETLGNDTLSVESFSVTADGYHGELLQRMPVTTVATYDAILNSDGSVTSMHIKWNTPPENPGGPKPLMYNISISDTTARAHLSGTMRGKSVDTTIEFTVPAGTVPGLGRFAPSVSTFNQIIRQAHLNNTKQSYSTHILSPGSKRLVAATLHHLGGDTLGLDMYGETFLATVNSQNTIDWASAMETTVKTITKPEPGTNISQLAAMFARRDAAGKGEPVASPLDSAKATVNGAHLKIVYCRPSMRGRQVWGKLVPWNVVWRTGANAATAFTTDKNIVIGNTKIPAGAYTIYSVYTPTSAKLIINSQTGQWGTVYHQDRDFARIDMQKTDVESHEKFTIAFDQSSSVTYLRLIWATSEYSVPIK